MSGEALNRSGRGGLDITVTGDEALVRAFDALDEAVQKKALRRAARAVGKDIATLARSKVRRLSGRLAASIKVKALPRKRGVVGIRVVTGSAQELGIPKTPGTKVPGYYPMHLEKGLPAGGRRQRQNLRRQALETEVGTRGQPARPYLRPALDELREPGLRKLGEVLWEEVRAAAKAGAGATAAGGPDA